MTPWLVAAVGVAALIIPFVLPRTGEMPASSADIEEVAGKRSMRSVASATVLLAIIGLGLYSVFDLGTGHRYTLALYGGFFAALAVTVIAQGRIRVVCLRILEGYLVAIGLIAVAGGLWNLWTAAWEGRALMPSRSFRQYWVSVHDAPGLFWFSVVASAVMIQVALYLLREYFVGRFLRSKSRALPQADDEGA